MKSSLSNSLTYLKGSIDITDFNTIERSLKNHLRFELGDDLESGTKERVLQAKNRATLIFENFIDLDKDIFVISYDFIDDLFAIIPSYFYDLLKTVKSEVFSEKIATRYFVNEDNVERIDGKLGLFRGKASEIDYESVFLGIANLEMGFSPAIHQVVYFFQPETKKWFWMYDDRGCIVFSHKKDYLRDTFLKYEEWLVSSQKNQMVNF